MTGHTASIYSLAFSQESSVLVSGSADWTIRCWDVKCAGGLLSPSIRKDSWTSDAAAGPNVINNRDFGEGEACKT